MGKKLRCPVFVFIQGAYLCLHLCLFVHVMLTSAPAVPFSECDVCFTSVSHKSPHCQRCPPKRVRQTTQTSRWRRIVICKNAFYQTLPGRLGAFFSHPQRFWSSWTDVSNFNDKNDFNLQFMASICSGPPHLSPPKKSHSLPPWNIASWYHTSFTNQGFQG